MRGDNIHDQINIVEEKLTTYKPESSDELVSNILGSTLSVHFSFQRIFILYLNVVK